MHYRNYGKLRESAMRKGLFLVIGVTLACAGCTGSAAAMSQWERALIQRYTSKEKCDGHNAPAWGRASMQRWRNAQRAYQRR
jgi:hypothetical protein